MAFVCSALIVPAGSGFETMAVDEEAAAERAVALSADRRVVHVQAEFWAGDGLQAATGWERGQIAFGPRRTQTQGEDEPGYETVSDMRDMAINEALRWLGVAAEPGKDEFDTLGLLDLDPARAEWNN